MLLLGGPETGFTRQPEIYVIRVSNAISPGTADYLKKGIQQAAEDQAALVIVELDTPGGTGRVHA